MLLKALLLASLCLRPAPGAVGSCSCDCPPPPEMFRAVPTVFLGTVRSLRPARDTLRPPLVAADSVVIWDMVVAEVEIDEPFKGPRSGTLEVRAVMTGNETSYCGLRLAVGERYLLYAAEWPGFRPGARYVGACGSCGSGRVADRVGQIETIRAASITGDTLVRPRPEVR